MKPIGTLSTVDPSERATRAKRPLTPCDRCGWRQKRSPQSRYCAPCKDEIDIAKDERSLIKLRSRRPPATKIDHLSGIQRPW